MAQAPAAAPGATPAATTTPAPASSPRPTPSSSASRNSKPPAPQQKSAADAQEKLKADIAAIGQDRSKLNQQLIDIAAQVRGVETRIGDAEARLRPLDTREQEIRGSLDSRRSEIVEVLAALQRAGRRSPPALLVRPEDALQSLRTAMLLGSVVPELRARAQKLAGDLGELVALRKTIATERDRLAADRDKLKDDQTRLAALVDERQRQQSSVEKDMAAESARAIALSRQVDSLQGLIAKMEQDSKTRGEGGRDRQPARGARQPQRQAESGGAEGSVPAQPGDRLCVGQRPVRLTGEWHKDSRFWRFRRRRWRRKRHFLGNKGRRTGHNPV